WTGSATGASTRGWGARLPRREAPVKQPDAYLRATMTKRADHAVRRQAVRRISAPAPGRRFRGHRGGIGVGAAHHPPPRGTRLGRRPGEGGGDLLIHAERRSLRQDSVFARPYR